MTHNNPLVKQKILIVDDYEETMRKAGLPLERVMTIHAQEIYADNLIVKTGREKRRERRRNERHKK